MKFFVHVTDTEWFNYLASFLPEEINFWKPGGHVLRDTEIGAPFLFKLRQPENKIVGGGFFIGSEKMPLSLAWEAFGNKNGAADFVSLRNKINSLRGGKPESDPEIGSIILNNPFFFPRELWFEAPHFASNIPLKLYDTAESDGKKLWFELQSRLNDVDSDMGKETVPLYGKEYLTQNRIGHGAFKVLVTGTYKRKCAISNEKALPVLQAAHIKPYSKQGPNKICNGLLLRSDLHILFDKGYLTILPDYKILVSKKIKEQFHNGENYYAFQGKELYLPELPEDKPEKEFLCWHNDEIFEKIPVRYTGKI